jgi:hypothetical protein
MSTLDLARVNNIRVADKMQAVGVQQQLLLMEHHALRMELQQLKQHQGKGFQQSQLSCLTLVGSKGSMSGWLARKILQRLFVSFGDLTVKANAVEGM